MTYSQVAGAWVPGTATLTIVNDATTSTKGIVELGGDLAGAGTTASAPTITAGAVTGAKIAGNTITDANVSPSAAIAQSKVSGLTASLAGKAATGANSDITSLSGLSTPLSVGQGRNGVYYQELR
ncbi:MAG: hypothetical protein WDN27_00935 [Candidatus Saccharibacteria bacterium]